MPGQSKQVSFTLSASDLAFLGIDLKPLIEPGQFILWAAPSAEAAGLKATFEVTA